MIIKHQHYELMQKVVLERIVFKPPLKANGSMHNEACFLYAVNGSSTLYGPSEKQSLNSHEGVVMKCGNYLNSWLQNADEKPSEAVAVHFYPEVLKMIYEDRLPDFLKQKERKKPVSIEKVLVDDMINKYIESLVFYFENPSLINDELIVLKVKELILLLVNTDESNRIHEILQDLFNPSTYDFKDLINSNLFENLNVDDLAVLANMSLSSFKRKFSQVFDDSPAHYIRTKRLEKASEMLLVDSNRISDICYACGFSDLGHFSKSFTNHFGISPSAYRDEKMKG